MIGSDVTPNSAARAALLAGTLASTPLPDTFVERDLRVPAIRLIVNDTRGPLNLDAAIFRYRIALDGTVRVLDGPAGARMCWTHHRHG